MQEFEKHSEVKLSVLGKSVRVLSIPIAGQPSASKMIPFVVEAQTPSTSGPEQKEVKVSEVSQGVDAGKRVLALSDVKLEWVD